MRFFLVSPVATKFRITNPFNAPRPYANGRHEGIDLRALEEGKAVPILAAQRGVVDRIRQRPAGYGLYVRIRHDWADGTVWVTWYAHMSRVEPGLQVGQFVQIGQRLGMAGDSGTATGVHLHLTLQHLGYGLKGYVIDDVVDPTPYFSNIRFPDVDEAQPVADLTVPAGTLLEAGKRFRKVWRVRNSGTSTWTDGYALTLVGRESLGGPDSVPLPPLKPGELAEVAVDLVTPLEPGRHRATWKPRDAEGKRFPFEFPVDIRSTPVAFRDDAVYVSDVTVPDGTAVAPGQSMLKTWRIRNTGDATWEAGYHLAFHSGQRMGAPELVSLPRTRPGATADVSVPLTAPAEPGLHRSTWRPLDPEGHFFGDFVFAEVVVQGARSKSGRWLLGPMMGGGKVDDAVWVKDGNRPQESTGPLRVAAGEGVMQTWTLRNTGGTRWKEGYSLAFTGDNPMGAPPAVPLPPAAPGETVEVAVPLTAPPAPGRHRTSWQPRNAGGTAFGEIVSAEFEVVPLGTADHLDYVADVTVPDGTGVRPGDLLQKTWRVRNAGNSAWVPGYALVFVANEQMEGPDSVLLPLALPGEEVEVTVELVAPATPGLLRSTWRARNLDGRLFGDLIYAEVRVAEPGSNQASLSNAQLDSHVTVPAGTEMTVGQRFTKTWGIRNTGATVWNERFSIVFTGGDRMGGPEAQPLPATEPGQVAQVSLDLVAPPADGQVIGRWRLRDGDGRFFGPTFFVSITITADEPTVDLVDYLRGDGRLYEMKHIFQTPGGFSEGQQRVQTQREGSRFYITKNNEWEELWFDDHFIYRGTDTSPGGGNFYTLMEDSTYGSPWAPRRFAVGRVFRREPTVVSRRKRDCVVNMHLSGPHVTWLRFEALHKTFRLPDVQGFPNRGIEVQDVAVLGAYQDAGGRPAGQPFERYYYAKGFGMVMWEGIDVDHRGKSFLVEAHRPGARPPNIREHIPCLDPLIRRDPVVIVPPAKHEPVTDWSG
jgi:hypothetical protein